MSSRRGQAMKPARIELRIRHLRVEPGLAHDTQSLQWALAQAIEQHLAGGAAEQRQPTWQQQVATAVAAVSEPAGRSGHEAPR